MIRCLSLAALVLAAATPGSAQAATDSLLVSIIERVGLNRFYEKDFSERTSPFRGSGLPLEAELNQRWINTYTFDTFMPLLRAEFLAKSSHDDVLALAEWVEDPVVRAVIAADYSGGGLRPGGYERIEDALTMRRLDPRFEAAIRRIAEAAGDGAIEMRWQVEEAAAYGRYVRAFMPPRARPSDDEIEAMARDHVESDPEVWAREFLIFVGTRFEGVPMDALEHYAEALHTPAGRVYLRLVVETPNAVRVGAIQKVLDKALPKG